MRERVQLLLVAAAILVGLSLRASADTLFTFTYAGQSQPSVSFDIPTGATTPLTITDEVYGYPAGTVQFGTLNLTSDVVFAANSFYLTAGGGLYPSANFVASSALWSGSNDDPSFLPGNYTVTLWEGWVLNAYGDFVPDGLPYGQYSGTLTIAAVTPAPEPSGIALLGTGLVAVLARVRRHTRVL